MKSEDGLLDSARGQRLSDSVGTVGKVDCHTDQQSQGSTGNDAQAITSWIHNLRILEQELSRLPRK